MKYGLIGEKLSHSFSAEIHTEYLGLDYQQRELSVTELDAFLTERKFEGINVTVPYKETVMSYLDEIDDAARRIGAVNTIVNRNGKLYGCNTDFNGLCALMEYSGISVRDKKVLILGSGGTSKTALAVVKYHGCASVVRVSRTAREDCVTYEQAKAAYHDAQILINTTPCGMYPNSNASPVNVADFPCLEGVVDVVYNPLCTRLVCDARHRGIPAVGGLYMLVAQAVSAAEKFTDQSIHRDRVGEIYRHLVVGKKNIVLIGMPSCGKTTVGKRLAEMLKRPFIDTDAVIVRKIGRSIPELFADFGEKKFREIEADVIREIASQQGAVIATGGGAVMYPENVMRLKENGWVCFLDRSLSMLTATSDRPLSSTTDDLQKRYEERYPIYSAACDRTIAADASPEEVASLVREGFLNEDFDR